MYVYTVRFRKKGYENLFLHVSAMQTVHMYMNIHNSFKICSKLFYYYDGLTVNRNYIVEKFSFPKLLFIL